MEPRSHESVKFLELLESDANGMYNLLTAASIEQFRRGYVRAQFACIEGAIAVLRRHALLMKHMLETGEMVLLEEKTYRVNDKGKVKDSVQFVKFEQNVRFVFATTAKAYQLEFELDKKGSEWKALLAGVDIRNRLTHPKTINDMEVTELEINVVRLAGLWFMKQAMALLLKVLTKEEELRRERFGKLLFPSESAQGLGLNTLLPLDEQLTFEAEHRLLEELLSSSAAGSAAEDNTSTNEDAEENAVPESDRQS
jgi:hypothetical protein